MKASILLLVLVSLVSHAHASETDYFSCTSTSSHFQQLRVAQIITQNGNTFTSTFVLKVAATGQADITYAQVGNVVMGSDDTFNGSFVSHGHRVKLSIQMPSFPDYGPQKSVLVSGGAKLPLVCESLN